MSRRAMRRFNLVVGTIIAAAAGGQGHAQEYPDKPIRIIVPFAPGGGAHITARIVSQKLIESWGQQVLIDSRPGASTNIGAMIVVKAARDGYTLLLATPAQTINPGLFRDKLPYNPASDFAPVALLGMSTMVLVVHPSVPAKSVKELIVLARSKPGQLNNSSSGSGSAGHLAGELFKTRAGIDIVHIPYKGAAPSVTALVAGEVSFSITSALSVMPFVKSGRSRALAVTSAQRSVALPELPTVAESGLPGFEVMNWLGVLSPADTPRAVVDKLNAELARIVMLPDVRAKFSEQGVEPYTFTPSQFAAFIKSEIAKWTTVVRDSGAQAD
mgnify:CR=1 FL=1